MSESMKSFKQLLSELSLPPDHSGDNVVMNPNQSELGEKVMAEPCKCCGTMTYRVGGFCCRDCEKKGPAINESERLFDLENGDKVFLTNEWLATNNLGVELKSGAKMKYKNALLRLIKQKSRDGYNGWEAEVVKTYGGAFHEAKSAYAPGEIKTVKDATGQDIHRGDRVADKIYDPTTGKYSWATDETYRVMNIFPNRIIVHDFESKKRLTLDPNKVKRIGNTHSWLEEDTDDARNWMQQQSDQLNDEQYLISQAIKKFKVTRDEAEQIFRSLK